MFYAVARKFARRLSNFFIAADETATGFCKSFTETKVFFPSVIKMFLRLS